MKRTVHVSITISVNEDATHNDIDKLIDVEYKKIKNEQQDILPDADILGARWEWGPTYSD